jgi:sn-glycerol 3-phosphate transport system permease protein
MALKKTNFTIILTHLILIVVCFLVLFPTFWMISTSFKFTNEMFTEYIELLPKNPTLINYLTAFKTYPVVNWLINSSLASFSIVLGQIITGLLAAYSLARFKFFGRNFIFMLVLGTLLVPFQVTMIPNYIIVSKLQWLNTQWAVIVPYLASGFAVFFLRQHILTIPEELFDATLIDGANSFQTFLHIIIPLSKTPVFALTVLLFINAWNMYFWPLLVLNSPQSQTIAIGIRQFLDAEKGYDWGSLTAAATLASLPTMIVYIFTQRYIINMSITSGLK